MSDFTTLRFQLNTGTNATPVWTSVPSASAGTGQELRFAAVATAGATSSSAWPPITLPTSGTAGVNYLYVFTTDTTSLGALGSSTNVPAAFSSTNHYRHLRLDWDALGTFASAPIFTAYNSTSHTAITRGSPAGGVLEGHTADTGATPRSYLKGNAWGRVDSAGVPTTNPSVPGATDGTTGAAIPTAGANWLATWQGLMGDLDYIQAPFIPAATTAGQWSLTIRLVMGASSLIGISTPVISAKYTFS